jgi:hypothetical protein
MIGACRTPWFATLADDDLFDPDHLETLWTKRGDADLVFSWGRMSDGTETYKGEWSPYRLARRQDAGIRGTFLAKKSLWEKVGGYDAEHPNDDWDFLMRVLEAGAVFKQILRETWTYRRHDKSLSTAFTEMAEGKHPTNPYYLKRFL